MTVKSTKHGISRNVLCCFFFNDTATTEISTLSLHDALPIYPLRVLVPEGRAIRQPIDAVVREWQLDLDMLRAGIVHRELARRTGPAPELVVDQLDETRADIADDKGVERLRRSALEKRLAGPQAARGEFQPHADRPPVRSLSQGDRIPHGLAPDAQNRASECVFGAVGVPPRAPGLQSRGRVVARDVALEPRHAVHRHA